MARCAIGIGLQNLPEGLAVALPLRRDGMNRWKALWYGQLTAVVEPIGALLGAAIVTKVTQLEWRWRPGRCSTWWWRS